MALNMNKILPVILLILAINASNANDLKKALQGTWLCTKILDQHGQPTNGKFGASDEYLKFNFNKSKLLITQAPFDFSQFGFIPKYGVDFIDLVPKSVFGVPEQIYFVKALDSINLILSTLNQNKDSIYYHFVSGNYYSRNFNPKPDVMDLGLVVVKHLKLKYGGANRVSKYIIPNNTKYLSPSPIFKGNGLGSFARHLSINLKFPSNYPIDSISKELVIDFDVGKKGIENMLIVQGVNPQLDTEVIRILEMTKKNWKPININDKIIESRFRLHFIFYLGKMEIFSENSEN